MWDWLLHINSHAPWGHHEGMKLVPVETGNHECSLSLPFIKGDLEGFALGLSAFHIKMTG
jgi:hypothetical protein